MGVDVSSRPHEMSEPSPHIPDECSRMQKDSTTELIPTRQFFQEERLLNDEGWVEEANGVIKEVEAYVKQLTISSSISSSSLAIHLNLVTLENANYTVRLCERGFSIVADQLDSVHWDGETVYETPHSLLDNISLGYRQVFLSQSYLGFLHCSNLNYR